MNQACTILISLAAELLPVGPIASEVAYAAAHRSRTIDVAAAMWSFVERDQPSRWHLVEKAMRDVAPFEHIELDAFGAPGHISPNAQSDAVDAVETLAAAGTFDTLDAIAEGGNLLSPPRLDSYKQFRLQRMLYKACVTRMELALIHSIEREPSRAFRQAIGLARAVGQQPTDHLAGMSIASAACVRVRAAARRHPDGRTGAADLRAMIAALDEPVLPPLKDHMLVMHVWWIADAEFCYALDGTPLVRTMARLSLPPRRWNALGSRRALFPFLTPFARWLVASRERTHALIAARIRTWYDIADLPPREAALAALEIPTEYATHDAPADLATSQWRSPIPIETYTAANQARLDFTIAATRLVLAIECHQRETGAYPDTLDDLVPGILVSLPIDPITGTPFGYRKHRDTHPPDTAADCYTLYSRGYDRVDDGAAPHPVSNARARRDLNRLLIPDPPQHDLRHVIPWLPPPEPIPAPVIGVDFIIDHGD